MLYDYVSSLLGISNLGVFGYVLSGFVLVVLISLVYELLYQIMKWVAMK